MSASIGCTRVDLLIGQDYAEALLPLQVRSGPPKAPFAVKFLFGWGLCGSVRKPEESMLLFAISFL